MQMITLNPNIEKFIEAIQRGREALEEAGRILVAMVDEDPVVTQAIQEAHPEITGEMLETFERIGRRQLHPQVYLMDGPGYRALSFCAYSEQVKYLKEPIPMLLLNGQDSTDHINVELQALSRDQVRQVFAITHVRTLNEQRAYLERQRPVKIRANEFYTLGKGKIVFHRPVELSRATLQRLLEEMS